MIDWLRENWFWLTVVVLFFWMHGKMHGGHGSHGSHGGCGGHHKGQSHEDREPPEGETHHAGH